MTDVLCDCSPEALYIYCKFAYDPCFYCSNNNIDNISGFFLLLAILMI